MPRNSASVNGPEGSGSACCSPASSCSNAAGRALYRATDQGVRGGSWQNTAAASPVLQKAGERTPASRKSTLPGDSAINRSSAPRSPAPRRGRRRRVPARWHRQAEPLNITMASALASARSGTSRPASLLTAASKGVCAAPRRAGTMCCMELPGIDGNFGQPRRRDSNLARMAGACLQQPRIVGQLGGIGAIQYQRTEPFGMTQREHLREVRSVGIP